MARRLALGVVEVGGHGDDRLAHRHAQRRFGVGLERTQDEGGEFFRAVFVAFAEAVTFAAAHVTLEGGGSGERVRDEAFARGLADEDGAVVIHADHRRGEDAAQGVLDELRLAVMPVGDEAVGGAEVDAEDGCGVHG